MDDPGSIDDPKDRFGYGRTVAGAFPIRRLASKPSPASIHQPWKKRRCRGKSDQAKQLLTLTQTHILIDIVHLTTMTNHGRACEVSGQPNVTCKINASLDANIYQ